MRFFLIFCLFVALKLLTIFSRISRKVCIFGQTYDRGIFMKIIENQPLIFWTNNLENQFLIFINNSSTVEKMLKV